MGKKSVVKAAVLCCSVLLVLLGMTNSAWSQTVTADIVGTITDPAGAAVQGAAVKITSVERGTTYSAVTDNSGLYRISGIPVGNYTLTAEKSGFETVQRESFVLVLNQVARIDIALKVGHASETVKVSGMAPILKTETTQVDTVINAATNDEMPLAARNYVQLTLLAPGAVSTDPSSFNNGNNTAGYGGRPLINGNREQANNFLLDGMDNNQVSDNLLGYAPAPDAIEEFN
ncbi:MAG: carboxypeptidase-like regulatory domain-containing protein, partial [Acidobacteriaceae bacterium]